MVATANTGTTAVVSAAVDRTRVDDVTVVELSAFDDAGWHDDDDDDDDDDDAAGNDDDDDDDDDDDSEDDDDDDDDLWICFLAFGRSALPVVVVIALFDV